MTVDSVVESNIPARLDRLPWGRFHTLVVVALGITWMLDGLEVTLAGSLAGALKDSPVLQFTNTDIGLASSAYLAGAVIGAVFFGWLTDRLGRKKLFFITAHRLLSWHRGHRCLLEFCSFALFRFVTGAGIGGEYAAINSTIQELIPARVRGWTDLVINGSFWLGAALGALGSLLVLDPAILNPEIGWRLAFLIGAVLALVIFFMRLWLPESPRWLMTHGRAAMKHERVIARHRAPLRETAAGPRLAARTAARRANHTPLCGSGADAVQAPSPAYLCRSRADGRSGIFLQRHLLHLRADSHRLLRRVVPTMSAVTCCRLRRATFSDRCCSDACSTRMGRRPMIAFTYTVSGLLLAVTGFLFARDLLTAQTQTLCWMIIFFFASAAASSAYLTVSETFPLEIRALAIALFYAIGTGIGGIVGPLLFGVLIDTGSRVSVFGGYLLGSLLMVLGGAVAWRWGVAAERKPLEMVARPLTFIDID